MRILRSVKLAGLSLIAVIGTACTGGGIPAPSLPLTNTVTTADAAGDATMPAPGATAWDITQVVTSHLTTGATTLNVAVTFAQPVSAANLPAPGSSLTGPTQLGVVILLNTGAVGGTISPGAGCVGSPSFANVAFAVDDGSLAARLPDGNFAIARLSPLAQTGEASVAFTGPNTVTYSIPLSAVGGGSGALQLAVIANDGAGTMVTDCAPNSSFIST